MSTKRRIVEKQEASSDEAAKEVITNTNTTTNVAELVEQVETPILLHIADAELGGKDIRTGDTFRLWADTSNGTAIVEVNPSDITRNPDKPNNWNAATREAYKALLRACIGLRVTFTFTDDRRATITETATITGCGMDITNDRATFTLSTGRKVASGYCFKAIGYDPDHRNTFKAKDSTPTAARTLASIQADIDKWSAKVKDASDKVERYKEERRKALEVEITAVKTILELRPTTREALMLCNNVPTANRIPQNVWQALQVMEKDNPVYCAMMSLYDVEQIAFAACEEDTPQLIANADKVLDVMKEKGLKVDDIPTDILP